MKIPNLTTLMTKLRILAGVCAPLVFVVVLGGVAAYGLNNIPGTGKDGLLDPYKAGAKSTHETMATLKDAVNDNPARVERRAEFKSVQEQAGINFAFVRQTVGWVEHTQDGIGEAIKPSGPHPITTTFIALARPVAEGASDEPEADRLQRVGPTGSIRKCEFDNGPNDNPHNLVYFTAGNLAVAAACLGGTQETNS